MRLKTIFWGLVGAFVLVSIVQSPVTSAALFKEMLDWLAGALAQLFAFFHNLLPTGGKP